MSKYQADKLINMLRHVDFAWLPPFIFWGMIIGSVYFILFFIFGGKK